VVASYASCVYKKLNVCSNAWIIKGLNFYQYSYFYILKGQIISAWGFCWVWPNNTCHEIDQSKWELTTVMHDTIN